jgi:hypothetical protein
LALQQSATCATVFPVDFIAQQQQVLAAAVATVPFRLAGCAAMQQALPSAQHFAPVWQQAGLVALWQHGKFC